MEELRPSLTLYAYNILGSYEDAKDIVQDVFLKFSQVPQEHISDKKSYLIKMVVNLSIDQKRRLKKQIKRYPGPWLPEPVATDDPHLAVHRKQILSYSMLVLLEKLDSKQRAVFILKEAFDYDHEEIARVLGITVDNSRKILSRAKGDLRADLNVTPDETQMKVLHQYIKVLEEGDLGKLEKLLNHDISVTSDGGGKVPAFRKIIEGIESVTALLSGLYKKIYHNADTSIGWINNQPAIFYFLEGTLVTCQIFSVQNQQLDRIFFVRNPDKLNGLHKVPS
jgi:RNA polymerase sigma factor (sigma-70 family)